MNLPGLSRRSFLKVSGAAAAAMAAPTGLTRARAANATGTPAGKLKELTADILVIGASFGGVAAALAAARMGRSVILTDETSWIGGQATTQGIPLDEHPWTEQYGRTRSYAEFREKVRAHYRRNYPLTDEA